MKYKVIANTSAHNFEIGQLVSPAMPSHPEESAHAWFNYQQVFMQDENNESWWIGLEELEIIK